MANNGNTDPAFMQYFHHQGGAQAGADGVGTYDGSTLNTVSTFGDTLRVGDTLPVGGSGTFVRTDTREAYVAGSILWLSRLPGQDLPPATVLSDARNAHAH